MRFIATCKIGLESVVSLELRRLGIEVEKVEDARVLFLGDYQTMAKACLWLRTAERVLMEVASFEARSFEELFQGVKAVSWRDYLKKDSFIHVNGKSAKSTLFSVSDCQRIEQLPAWKNSWPQWSGCRRTGGEVIIGCSCVDTVVTVALDCCGAGFPGLLSHVQRRRAYRRDLGAAASTATGRL